MVIASLYHHGTLARDVVMWMVQYNRPISATVGVGKLSWTIVAQFANTERTAADTQQPNKSHPLF